MPRHLSVDDLFDLRAASDPQITRDGSRIAFTVTSADRARDRLVNHVWVVPTGGGEAAQWTHGADGESSPRWSPQGDRLGFIAARGDGSKPQLHVLDARGGEAVRITDLPGGVADFAWSPDGSRIAVLAIVPQGSEETEADKAAPLEIRRLGYKYDGTGFLVRRRLHLFGVPAVGGEAVQLTDGDFSTSSPVWSPDGLELAFSASLHEDRDIDGALHLFTMPAAGGELRQVVGGTWAAAAPLWTEDGRLVFAGRRRSTDVQTSLYVVAPGGEPDPLLQGFDRTVMVGAPAYPGGRPALAGGAIVFCARIGGCTHVFRKGLDGNDKPAPVLAGDDHVVQGLSVAATGASAVVLGTVDNPGDVFRLQVSGREAVQLTSLNRELLEGVEVAPPQVRQFRAPDGVALEGYVWGGERGAGKPLLLNVHGGPHNAWTPALSSFELHQQELVAEGWCVLALNPRGSDGYGEAFMRAVQGGWGVNDEQDFVAAIDALVADGTVDPERIAVTGYSYGGFMTAWLCGRTNRFACGVAGGSVVNGASEYGTSDGGGHLADAEFGAEPFDDPELYRRLSPLTYVKDLTAPLLILHGERDDRCDLGQAEELFTALRRLRREVELVIYPGASHLLVVAGRPSHQADYQKRLLAWLRAHVPAAAPAVAGTVS